MFSAMHGRRLSVSGVNAKSTMICPSTAAAPRLQALAPRIYPHFTVQTSRVGALDLTQGQMTFGTEVASV